MRRNNHRAPAEMSAGDKELLRQFRVFLERTAAAEHLTQLEAWFDADMHLVTPAMCPRGDYIIIDGKIVPAIARRYP